MLRVNIALVRNRAVCSSEVQPLDHIVFKGMVVGDGLRPLTGSQGHSICWQCVPSAVSIRKT